MASLPINIPIPIPASNRGGPEPKRGFGWSGGRVGVSISGWNFLNVFGRYLVHRTKFRFHGFAPNKALAAEGFLLTLCRIAFVPQDFASPLTCLDLPRLASTCLDLPSPAANSLFPRLSCRRPLAYTCPDLPSPAANSLFLRISRRRLLASWSFDKRRAGLAPDERI